MKKFLLFAFNEFCPSGGMRDLQGSFNSYFDCIQRALSLPKHKYYQIVNTETWEVQEVEVTQLDSKFFDITSNGLAPKGDCVWNHDYTH